MIGVNGGRKEISHVGSLNLTHIHVGLNMLPEGHTIPPLAFFVPKTKSETINSL